MEQEIPSFFKVFLPFSNAGTRKNLLLPLAFTNYVEGKYKLPKRAVLRENGKTWPVSLTQVGHEFFFTHGWPTFVKDNRLKFGDMMFFQFDGDCFFDFKILEGSGWPLEQEEEEEEEEEEGVKDTELKMEDQGIEEDRTDAADHKGDIIFASGQIPRPRSPYFVADMAKRKRNELHVPSHVIKDFKLELGDKIFIQDEVFGDWESKVVKWKDGQVVLTDGWRQFCRWNNVKRNNWCICEFVIGSMGLLLKVQVLDFHDGSWVPRLRHQ